MAKVIGIITCNYTSTDSEFTAADRPIAAVPYVGRYRVIDFPLSNMINAGIRTVGVIMPQNFRALADHLGAGKEWSLDRKNGGLFYLPGSAFGTARRGARFLIRDLIDNKAMLTRSTDGYVVFSSANIVFNADIAELVDYHIEHGADITALTKIANEDDADVVSFDAKDEMVKGMKYGVKEGELAFLDTFVIKRLLLLDMLDWYAASDHLDLFEAILSNSVPVTIKTASYEGYCAAIFNKMSYYRANMNMLNPEVANAVFPSGRYIKTKTHDTPPAKLETGSKVTKSLISSGSRIYGEVSGSVLGRNVIVEPGATVSNSVIMQGTVVKTGAVIDYAIVDRNNIISAGTVIKGTPDNVFAKGKARN